MLKLLKRGWPGDAGMDRKHPWKRGIGEVLVVLAMLITVLAVKECNNGQGPIHSNSVQEPTSEGAGLSAQEQETGTAGEARDGGATIKETGG